MGGKLGALAGRHNSVIPERREIVMRDCDGSSLLLGQTTVLRLQFSQGEPKQNLSVSLS